MSQNHSNISIAIPEISTDGPAVFVTSPSRHAWMTAIRAAIQDKVFTDLVVPGTHNSASYSISPNGLAIERSFIIDVMLMLGLRKQLVSWLQTQDMDITGQLHHGIRALHFKVAIHSGHFFCYNGLTGSDFALLLSQIRTFAESYKTELIFIYLEDIKELSHNTVITASREKKKALHNLIINELGNNLVPFQSVFPTVRQVTKSGKNIFVFSNHSVGFSNLTKWFWPLSSVRTYQPAYASAKDVFLYLSEMQSSSTVPQSENKINLAFASVTPGFSCYWMAFMHSRLLMSMMLSFATMAGYILGAVISHKVSMTNTNLVKIMKKRNRTYCIFLSTITLLCCGCMLFLCLVRHITGSEACENSLLEMAQFINRNTKVLPSSIYSTFNNNNGLNSALYYWLSKPSLYKVNVIFVDGFQSSEVVQAAIDVNRGRLRHSITVTFVGNPLVGGRSIHSWFSCPVCQISYLLVSRDEGRVLMWANIEPGGQIMFTDGDHPMDSQIIIFAGSTWGKWFQLYNGNLQKWIDNGLDLYIRGSESRTGRGIAYISYSLDITAGTCLSEIPKGILNFTKWDINTIPTSKTLFKH